MTNLLVNSIYPLDYFRLTGTDSIRYPDSFWWSSKQRFSSEDASGNYAPISSGGTLTTEYLEIDLGRIRQVNYINFDVLRSPLDMTIEYDQVSTGDGSHTWVAVQRKPDMDFDSQTFYDPNSRNAWYDADYHFTDTKGNMVHTRYLRIGFHRRDEPWPTANSAAFRWPVFVKHMRIGRYVSGVADTVGPLVSRLPDTLTKTSLTVNANHTSQEVRQRFVLPSNVNRGTITPNILGFGVLVEAISPNSIYDESLPVAQTAWSLWRVDTTTPTKLGSGIETGTINYGKTWLDFYLPVPVAGDTTATYEVRVQSLQTDAVTQVYTATPNSLSNRPLPGTFTFTNGSTAVTTSVDLTTKLNIGDYLQRTDIPDQVFVVNAVTATTVTINTPWAGVTSTATAAIVFPFYNWNGSSYAADVSKHLVVRVWGDVADEGRDVLGNSYRHATRVDRAAYVQDTTKAGWISAPQPSQDAVESLYFDVRSAASDGTPTLTVLDAVRVAPRTPGVTMNVYYSTQGLDGAAPTKTADWDWLLWTPIQQTYVLRGNTIYQFPSPIRAAFIKLEFSNLNPLPFRIPNYPDLPPTNFRRFPTWVEQQFDNASLRNTVDDWFISNATPVQTQVLQTLADPVREFEYKQREFLAALSLGKIKDQQVINSGLVSLNDRALIDPVTAQKVYVQTSTQYQNTLLLTVDQDSLLGRVVAGRFKPTVASTPIEAPPEDRDPVIATVSTINDRVGQAYSHLAQTPMKFFRTARHDYKIDRAQFNKKAYFVGIDIVTFLRNNYLVVEDNQLIEDPLHDSVMLESNTWIPENLSKITDGQLVYVNYQIGDLTVTDEAVKLGGFAQTPLANVGQARNITAYGNSNKQGLQFFQHDDYELGTAYDGSNRLVTTIGRTRASERLIVPKQIIQYVDVAIVVGHATIPSPPTIDSGVVTGIAGLTVIAASFEGPFVPSYGDGIEGGGTYSNPSSQYSEAATVVSVAVVTTTFESQDRIDTTTVTGIAVVSATNTGPITDAATVTGIAIPSSADIIAAIESATAIGIAVPSALDTGPYSDAATAIAIAVISATGSYTPSGGSPTAAP